jgi:hypothetical protein
MVKIPAMIIRFLSFSFYNCLWLCDGIDVDPSSMNFIEQAMEHTAKTTGV